MHELTFKNGMKELNDEYPERQSANGDRMQRRYWRLLKDLTDEQFERAVETAISECRFFPKVSELRAFAGVQTARPAVRRGDVREAYARFFRGQGHDVPERGTFIVNAAATRRAPDGDRDERAPIRLPVAS